MKQDKYVEIFIKECTEAVNVEYKEKFIGWESLITVLVLQGMLIMLPEIKEWLKLGATSLSLIRQQIKQKLIKYAKDKDLDFPQAEQAAEIIANRLDEDGIKKIVKELEK